MSDAVGAARLFALDDEACAALARHHETPLFLYDAATAAGALDRLRATLPPRVRIAYAVKANPHPRLLELFAGRGASFDCASIGELERVSALRLPGDRIFFAGPGKRRGELERAVAMGVRVQAEGFEDLERLDSIAAQRGGETIDVNLRVHPSGGVTESNRIIGGAGPSAFGIDEEDAPEIVRRAQTLRSVHIRGLHVFAASNERDAQTLLATHAMVFAIARRLRDQIGTLEQIDLGGGLGVPYAPEEAPLDLERLGAGLADLLAQESWFRGEVVLEPGRYLAAACGVYLARVVRVKRSRGTRFVILEGGINHLIRPLLTGQAFPVKLVGGASLDGAPLAPATLAGPLCTSLDRLGEVLLPPLESGDLLAFGMAGAYGFSEGMTHFLSHPVPKEVYVE
jgi:diaminopimelate decarboxylase